MIKVIAELSGADSELYSEIALEQAELGTWEVNEHDCVCTMYFDNVQHMQTMLEKHGFMFNGSDLSDIEHNPVTEIEVGWGQVYRFTHC